MKKTRTTESTKGHIPPANSGACGVVVGDLLFIYGGTWYLI